MKTLSLAAQRGIAALRIGIGWLFFWAFLDKLFGLGFATQPAEAWIAGGSPTTGFLANATHGPFAPLYQSMAGAGIIDWLFMLGMAGVGFALLTGVAVRFAGYIGALIAVLMWTALLPPENNPFFDDHLLYALVFIALAHVRAGHYYGFGEWWENSEIVKKCPWLQ